MDKFSILNKYRSGSGVSQSIPMIQNSVIDSSDDSDDDDGSTENNSDPIEPDSDDSSATGPSLNESLESGSNEREHENEETDSESDEDSSNRVIASNHSGNKPVHSNREDSSSDDSDSSDGEEDSSEENAISTPNVDLKNDTPCIGPPTGKASQTSDDLDYNSSSSDDDSDVPDLQPKSAASQVSPIEQSTSSTEEDSDESDSESPKTLEKNSTVADCPKTTAPPPPAPPAPPPPQPPSTIVEESKVVNSAKEVRKVATQSGNMSSVLDMIKKKNFKLKPVNENIEDPSKATQNLTAIEANSNRSQPNTLVRESKAKSQPIGSISVESELNQKRLILSNESRSPKGTTQQEIISEKFNIENKSIEELEFEELNLKLLLVQKQKSILTGRRASTDGNTKLVSNGSYEPSKAEMENSSRQTNKNPANMFENRENAPKTQDSTLLPEDKQNHKQVLGSVLDEILNQGFRLKPTNERRPRLAKAKDKSQEEALKDALIKIAKAYHNDGEDSAYNDSHSEWEDQELIGNKS